MSDGSTYDIKKAQHGRVSSNDGWFAMDSKGTRVNRGRTKADVLDYLKANDGAL